MTGPELLRDVVAALPATDPVGAIVAALWKHDATVERLVRELAITRGVPEAVIRTEHGLPPQEQP